MNRKMKVAVLMGGKSAEHKISLISGREVVKNLDPKKYDVLPIVVSKDGVNWRIGEGKKNFKFEILNLKFDLAFIAMHGPYGEDGTIQGFLELLGISYTGSGVLASALGMNKIASRRLFEQVGLTVPKYIVLNKKDDPKIIFRRLKLPVFVKPSNQGSSVGTSFVKNKKSLEKALKLAWEYSAHALVEEYLNGIETTVGVLGNYNPQALPVVEIVPKTEFFDYKAKYNERLCDEIVPARIGKSLTKKAQQIAIKAYQTLGCWGFGRVDMIIKGQKIYVLEVNTIPGLTPVSLLPKAAQAAGIPYHRLLDRIIDFATP